MPVLPTAQADEFIAALRARLPDETVRHSVSVAEMMVSVADAAGIGRDQAVTAGLLHDCCRAMSGAVLLEAAERYGLPISEVQHAKPLLLHGPVAAEEARNIFGVEDEAVYDAIYWHSTGRPGYGKVGLALYFADFAESGRRHAEAEEARAILAARGFSEALLFVSDRKLAYVSTQPLVDPATEDFHAWLEGEFG